MTRPLIASLLGSAPVAMAMDYAHAHLSAELPGGFEAAQRGGAMTAAVERFTVQRGVAVVPVRGLLTFNNPMLERYLGWTTYVGLIETMTDLARNPDVASVVLEGDSPGGFVTGLDAAAQAVAECAAVKPVHGLVSPLAASGGYWLLSQATDISMTPGSVVGSIGIVVNASAPMQPDSEGDQTFVLTSTHARAKRPDPTTDLGRAELQRSLDEAEAQFHAVVAAGRGIPIEDLAARLSVTDDPRDGGATFAPADAIARGLADQAETRAAFYDRVFGTYASKPRTTASRGYAARAAAALAATL
ncbi:S49 family peptidase [Falsirhodobacter halotolerans]|uniref:S49 family peptidase n=1 Tax=Falsirhodobacter halotolerans TaxID=1146892 RepID=UPI001FD07EB8|nr:S49 family peptidase [Falsirhodobacter halotolerans]MCJ8139362.1 S49 family peptidase [Falsirhodobacter halotolerans]